MAADRRPVLVLVPRLDLVAREAAAALAAAHRRGPIFVAPTGSLVRVDRSSGTVLEVGPYALQLDLSAVLDVEDGGGGRKAIPYSVACHVLALPPELLADPDGPGFSVLRGVARHPLLVLPPDPLQARVAGAGYDPASGTYVLGRTAAKIDLPLTTRAADLQSVAVAAMDTLLEPFSEFPWTNLHDRARVAAVLLSALGRSLIDGPLPWGLVDAPNPGTGKGLLVDLVATIVTGDDAPNSMPTRSEEEVRKRLFSTILANPSLVVLDNLVGRIDSPSLAALLTARRLEGRVLGESRMLSVRPRSLFLGTGNQVELSSELERRALRIRLDARCEEPHLRRFRRADVRAWTQAERPRLLAAGLTVLWAHAAAGRPGHGLPALGSYESWDQVVRSAVMWAGERDPLNRVLDAERSDLLALLATWSDVFADRPLLARDLLTPNGSFANEAEALAFRDLLPEHKPESPRSLGKALQRLRDRPIDGLVLRRVDGGAGGARWRVERLKSGGAL